MGRYLNNASHFAGLFSALYLALLLCTPWLIRESTLLLPSSASVSAQETSGAASAAVEALRTALHARMRGTELGNDESRLADSELCDAYEVRRIQHDAQSALFQELRAAYGVLIAIGVDRDG